MAARYDAPLRVSMCHASGRVREFLRGTLRPWLLLRLASASAWGASAEHRVTGRFDRAHAETGRGLRLIASYVEARPALAWSARTARPESRLRPNALSLGAKR